MRSFIALLISLGAVACGTDGSKTDRCPETIEQCVANGDCAGTPLTWPAAQDPRNFGWTFCSSSNDFFMAFSCPTYKAVSLSYIDTSDEYDYNVAGMLVRVDHRGINVNICLEGDIAQPSAQPSDCTSIASGNICRM